MPGRIEAFVSFYAVTHHLAIIRCPLALNRPVQEEILGTNILQHDTVPRMIDDFIFVLVPIFSHFMFVSFDLFFD